MQSTDHPQDELLIVEALVHLGEDLQDTNAIRAARAGRLAREIAAEHGLDVGDALCQIDAIGSERAMTDHSRAGRQS